MENPVGIIILDSSAVMAGVASILRSRPGLRVHVIPWPGHLDHIIEQSTNAILIFDLASFNVDQVHAVACRSSSASMIGIDIQHRQAFTLFSNISPLSNIADMIHLIDQTAHQKATAPGDAGAD